MLLVGIYWMVLSVKQKSGALRKHFHTVTSTWIGVLRCRSLCAQSNCSFGIECCRIFLSHLQCPQRWRNFQALTCERTATGVHRNGIISICLMRARATLFAVYSEIQDPMQGISFRKMCFVGVLLALFMLAGYSLFRFICMLMCVSLKCSVRLCFLFNQDFPHIRGCSTIQGGHL